MSWLSTLWDTGASLVSDGASYVSGGVSSLFSPSSSASSMTALPTPEIVSAKIVDYTPETSFFDSLSENATNYFGKASNLSDIVKGGYSAYTAAQASSKQDKLIEQAEGERQDAKELARLQMLLQISKEKYALASRGSAGGGGGRGGSDASRQVQMINALNSAASTRINALNNLSTGYIMATKRSG